MHSPYGLPTAAGRSIITFHLFEQGLEADSQPGDVDLLLSMSSQPVCARPFTEIRLWAPSWTISFATESNLPDSVSLSNVIYYCQISNLSTNNINESLLKSRNRSPVFF